MYEMKEMKEKEIRALSSAHVGWYHRPNHSSTRIYQLAIGSHHEDFVRQ